MRFLITGLILVIPLAGMLEAQGSGRTFPGLRSGQRRLNPFTPANQQGRQDTGQQSTSSASQATRGGQQGIAPRLGTGMGSWGALTTMFRNENEGTKADLSATPTRVFMLRMADNVCMRPPGQKAWERVYYWRKTRILETGYQVDTGNRGRSIQAFFDGASLDCHGQTRWEFMRLDRECARIRFHQLKKINLEATKRPFHLELPGGYTLQVSKAIISITRVADSRFFIANLGPEKVVIHRQQRQTVLAWNECCLVPLLQGSIHRAVPAVAAPGERIYSLGRNLWRLAWGPEIEMKQHPDQWVLKAGARGGRVQWGNCGVTLKPGRKVVVRSFGTAVGGTVEKKIRSRLDQVSKKKKKE